MIYVDLLTGRPGYVPAIAPGSLTPGEPIISPGLTSQYWRGDKTWQSLNKAAVGLGSVDNTSDLNKPISTATQGALNSKADLVGGLVPTSQIPAIAITDFLGTVASQVAMLALSGQKGDFTIRSDRGTNWIIIGNDPTQLASWQELSYPAAPVSSVNGQIGPVVLSYTDVGAQQADSDLTAIAALTTTSFGRGFLPLADQGAARTYIGAGTSSFSGSFLDLSNLPSSTNTLWVDSGATLSGIRGRQDRPYATPDLAIAAASTGDHIFVRGSFTWTSAIISALNNITLWGYGATVTAASQSNIVFLRINGSGWKVFGLTLNGAWTNAADADSGVIEIQNTDTVVQDTNISNSAGYGIRMIQSWSRTHLVHNTIQGTYCGIYSALTGSSDVDGSEILFNTTTNNRHGGIRPHNNSAGVRVVNNLKVIGNTSKNNGSANDDNEIEIWGSFNNPIVTFNDVSGAAFAISLDSSTGGVVGYNTVVAGTYCAIETASCSGTKVIGNDVDATAVNPSINLGAAAIVASGTNLKDISVEHNLIKNGTLGSAIKLSSCSGARVRSNDILNSGQTPFSFTNCSNVWLVDNYAEQTSDTTYGVYNELANGTTQSGFYYRNNRFNHLNNVGGSSYSIDYFVSDTSSPATWNDVHIEGTRTNLTRCDSGFVQLNPGTNTVSVTYKDNEPQENHNGGGFGFQDTSNVYTATVRNVLNVGGAQIGSNPLSVTTSVTGTGFAVSGNAPQFSLYNSGVQKAALGLATGSTQFSNISVAGDVILRGLSTSGRVIITNQNSQAIIFATGTSFSNDTEKMRVSFLGGVSVGSTTEAGAGNLLLSGLTASSFIEADASKILVSKTAIQFNQDLGTAYNQDVAKSINFTIAATDRGKLFEVTTGASDITATLPAAAAAGNGFFVLLRKADSGTGKVLSSPSLTGLGIQGHQTLVWTDGTTYYKRDFYGSFDTSGNLTITSPGSMTLTPGAASTLGANFGLVIGTNIQAYSANLTTFAGLTFDTDATLAAASATRVPAQSAVKSYVDNAITGLRFKQNARFASTANVTISNPGTSTFDGGTASSGDRIVLKNQTTGSQNGIYIFNGSSSAMTRATDGDTGAELISATFPVSEGTANQDTWWTVTNDTITLGTTAIVFTQTGGAGTYSADEASVHLSGNQFSIKHGAQIFDTAGTPTVAADFGSRLLNNAGGSQVLDWSGTNRIYLFDGSFFIQSDGTTNLISPTVGTLTHQFGYDIGVGGTWSPNTGNNDKISSVDGFTYIDNSGVYSGGTLSLKDTASAGFSLVLSGTGATTLTANRTLTLNMGNVAHTLAFGTTANTITFPNAASGTVPFLNLAQTWTAPQTNSYTATASTPAMLYSGSPFAGTGTTSFPLFYINQSTATASTSLSTSGTMLGVNAHGTPVLLDLLVDGLTQFRVSSTGSISTNSGVLTTASAFVFGASSTLSASGRATLSSPADGIWVMAKNAGGGFTRLDLAYSTNSGSAIGFDAVNGLTLQSAAGTSTWNDASTANSGTVANRYLFGIAAPTLTATGTSVTNTVASTVYIGGAPTDSTNTTSTTKWALNVQAQTLLKISDAGTTTVVNPLTLGHGSSGTPAAGLGVAILFNINSSTTADQNAAQIAALWTTATHASRTSDLVFYTVNNAAALAEAARFTGALDLSLQGHIIASIAGKGLQLKSGTNQRGGDATLVGGSITVSNTSVTAATRVMLTRKTSGGTIGTAITYTVSAGSGFTITSDNVLDTSTFTYFLFELN